MRKRYTIPTIILTVLIIGTSLGAGIYHQYQYNQTLEEQNRIHRLRISALEESSDLNVEYISILKAVMAGAERQGSADAMTPEQITKVARVIMEQAELYEEDGLTPALILGIIKRESNFDPKAKSHASARGIMQVMLETAGPHLDDLGYPLEAELLYDPVINIRIGTRELVRLHKIYVADGLESRDDFRFSLTSYFWGPRNTRILYSSDGRVDDAPSLEYSIGVLKNKDEYLKDGVIP